MRVAFRTDASLAIGTGHVMRCVTLADALTAKGVHCEFVSRAHAGNLIEWVKGRGPVVHELPAGAGGDASGAHAHWLGATQADDARATAQALGATIDWLVVDHYGIDAAWERTLRSQARRLLVIDDLADRPHDCELLLDQTYGRAAQDYTRWVPPGCELLCGSSYALLRPEFAGARAANRRRQAGTAASLRLLVTMGGVDTQNVTGEVLGILDRCTLPAGTRVTVVMGPGAPSLEKVRAQATAMRLPTEVLQGVGNMAELMAQSDLAIGASGATAWERCCMGLPSIAVVLAPNQRGVAEALQSAGAARAISSSATLREQLPVVLAELLEPGTRSAMGRAAAALVDGAGAGRVLARMLERS